MNGSNKLAKAKPITQFTEMGNRKTQKWTKLLRGRLRYNRTTNWIKTVTIIELFPGKTPITTLISSRKGKIGSKFQSFKKEMMIGSRKVEKWKITSIQKMEEVKGVNSGQLYEFCLRKRHVPLPYLVVWWPGAPFRVVMPLGPRPMTDQRTADCSWNPQIPEETMNKFH